MLAWEKEAFSKKTWRFLRVEQGRGTIYDRFRANVFGAGLSSIIVPIVATSFLGMKLLKRLKLEGRLSSLPQVIYLDSAHEAKETLLELHLAWNTLENNGILFGDDWLWDAVQVDLLKFTKFLATHSKSNFAILKKLQASLNCTFVNENLLLHQGQWILAKA